MSNSTSSSGSKHRRRVALRVAVGEQHTPSPASQPRGQIDRSERLADAPLWLAIANDFSFHNSHSIHFDTND